MSHVSHPSLPGEGGWGGETRTDRQTLHPPLVCVRRSRRAKTDTQRLNVCTPPRTAVCSWTTAMCPGRGGGGGGGLVTRTLTGKHVASTRLNPTFIIRQQMNPRVLSPALFPPARRAFTPTAPPPFLIDRRRCTASRLMEITYYYYYISAGPAHGNIRTALSLDVRIEHAVDELIAGKSR